MKDMEKISDKSKKYLLNIARESILAGFDDKMIEFKNVPNDVKANRGVFVTLKIAGRLRGCIGNIEPGGEVFKKVGENARHAAFDDPRFAPLTRSELPQTSIEVSILSEPLAYKYSTVDELVQMCASKKPGLVIEQGPLRATYLPQVWGDINSAEEFLSSLCMKAGLEENTWRETNSGLKVYTYDVLSFDDERG